MRISWQDAVTFSDVLAFNGTHLCKSVKVLGLLCHEPSVRSKYLKRGRLSHVHLKEMAPALQTEL